MLNLAKKLLCCCGGSLSCGDLADPVTRQGFIDCAPHTITIPRITTILANGTVHEFLPTSRQLRFLSTTEALGTAYDIPPVRWPVAGEYFAPPLDGSGTQPALPQAFDGVGVDPSSPFNHRVHMDIGCRDNGNWVLKFNSGQSETSPRWLALAFIGPIVPGCSMIGNATVDMLALEGPPFGPQSVTFDGPFIIS